MENSEAFRDVPDCVPSRILCEYAYCPRLAYIEWVQADFADNYQTVEGRFRHRVVDREEGRLPEPDDADGSFHARSVWLSAPGEHLTARIDLIEGEGNAVTVVEYKRGTVPDTPERSWESDRVQLCAQCLVLRANGYSCQSGILYYAGSKTRAPVCFSDELVDLTRRLVLELMDTARQARLPPPLESSKKCEGCSIAGICLPDEVNFLGGAIQDDSEGGEKVRRLAPGRNPALPLYVQHQGAFVGIKGELLQVKSRNEKIGEARMFETSQVALFGNVQISTQALREMCTRSIPVSFFSTGGWFYGLALGLTHKNVELRLAQYEMSRDPVKSLAFASAVVEGKIKNQRTLLMRNHEHLEDHVATRLSQLAKSAGAAERVESLLGIEGSAARVYFSHFAGMLKSGIGSGSREGLDFDFNGRNRRPPLDPVNAMLSYAYSLLAKDLTVATLGVGFDPFLGFFHKPRYGRPALALDLMEEFRPIICDSVVISAVNNGVMSTDDFVRRGPAVSMKESARKKFIQAYERRMDTLITHPVFGYRISYRRILEVQARLLARVLTGELAEYRPFLTR